jgi:hypothetical protein
MLDLGTPVNGEKIAPADLAGKPVVLVLWNAGNGSSLSCLSRLQGWDDELRNFGLVTLAQHLTGKQTVDVAKVALDRNLSLAVSESKWTNLSPVKNFTDFPLCLVFDHEGKTVYEGSPFDAEQAVRKAVGGALAASLAKEEIPKPLAVIVEALKNGSPPQAQLPKLASLARSKTAAGNELAAGLLERMTQEGRKELDAARAAMEKDPVAAFVAFEKLAAGYKGSPLGTEATQSLGKLRPQKPVQLEIQARQALALVKKIDAELNSKSGSFDPLQDRFQAQNAALIKELRESVLRMEKSWPKALATREALAIGRKYWER